MIKTSAVGRLTKSSELRVTSTGKAVANFALACKRERLDKDGNAQTTFIQCVIWGKPAEVLAKYTQKGSLIAVMVNYNHVLMMINKDKRIMLQN